MPEGMASSSSGMSGAPAVAAVLEVTTSDAFQQHCTNLTGLCIVAAFNPSADDFATHKATLQVSSVRMVLCCAALRCAVLRCAVLRCSVLCCAVLCCAVLCCAVLCCAVLCVFMLLLALPRKHLSDFLPDNYRLQVVVLCHAKK